MTSAVTAYPRLGEADVTKPANDDAKYYSVTTILNTLSSYGLDFWTREQVAKAAVDDLDAWAALVKAGRRAEAIKLLMDSPWAAKDGHRTAAELGSAIHEALEQYALTGARPIVDDEVRPYLDSLDRLFQRLQPEFVAAEAAVFNETYGYAGTLDAVAVIDGQRCLLDYKTSREHLDRQGKVRTPYPDSAALQLAAYRHGEMLATWRARRITRFQRFYLLNDLERQQAVPVPEVDAGVIIQIDPVEANAFPMRCDAAVFEYFCHVLDCFMEVRGIQDRDGAPLQAVT